MGPVVVSPLGSITLAGQRSWLVCTVNGLAAAAQHAIEITDGIVVILGRRRPLWWRHS